MIPRNFVNIVNRRRCLAPALLLALTALCTSASKASATVLAYGGDWNNGLSAFSYICQPCTTGGNRFDKSYENFIVPVGQQWAITDIFANMFFQSPVQTSEVTSAEYEIRSGVVPGKPSGSAGTLLFSGTESVSITPTASTVLGPSGKVTATLSVPIVLTAGEYWVSLSAIATSSVRRLGTYGTSGANGIGDIVDGGVRWTDDFGGMFFLSDHPNQQTADISLGLIGTTNAMSTPEPASLALFGLGLAAFGLTRRRLA